MMSEIDWTEEWNRGDEGYGSNNYTSMMEKEDG